MNENRLLSANSNFSITSSMCDYEVSECRYLSENIDSERGDYREIESDILPPKENSGIEEYTGPVRPNRVASSSSRNTSNKIKQKIKNDISNDNKDEDNHFDINLLKSKQWEEKSKQISRLIETEELWDTDLEDECEEIYDPTGRNQYRQICFKMGIVPVKYFLQHIEDTNLILKHHGLGHKGAKAITRALADNSNVELLDLSGNWIETEGGREIGKLLALNTNISKLVVTDNRLKNQGAQYICRQLIHSVSITSIDLSGNLIGNELCKCLAEILKNNKFLRELYLSRNDISSEGAQDLAEAISFNDILKVLDLSWNKIRSSGGIALIKGIQENIRIKKCNLSWNGLGAESCSALLKMFRENLALETMDLSGNRLTSEVVLKISKVVAQNETLTSVVFGDNPVSADAVLQLLQDIEQEESSQIAYLGLMNIPIHLSVIDCIKRIQSKRQFVCAYGQEMRTSQPGCQPISSAMRWQSHLRRILHLNLFSDCTFINLLKEFDLEKTMCVTSDQFAEALMDLGISYTHNQLTDVQKKFDKFKNGTIYYGCFINEDEDDDEDDDDEDDDEEDKEDFVDNEIENVENDDTDGRENIEDDVCQEFIDDSSLSLDKSLE